MAEKYKLLEIEQLNQIGYKFEYDTIKEFFTETKNFVNINDDEIFPIVIPGFDTDHYLECNDDDSSYNKDVWDIDEKIKRLRRGIIQKDDYQFIVHPVWKDNHFVLIKAWENKKIKFGVDSKELFYYQKAYGVDHGYAVPTTLLNEVYRMLILALPPAAFIKPPENLFDKHQKQIDKIYQRYNPDRWDVGSNRHNFTWQVRQHNIEKVKNSIYEEMFDSPMKVAERASFLYNRITKHPIVTKVNQATSVKDKELVLRFYLKTQTPDVKNSKNTRGRGIHKAKKQQVIDYFEENPDSNISAAANALGLDRKTVRKHKP